MTMVIVTHEMAFARDVANHVIFMDDGYIVEEGTWRKFSVRPRTKELSSSCSVLMTVKRKLVVKHKG